VIFPDLYRVLYQLCVSQLFNIVAAVPRFGVVVLQSGIAAVGVVAVA
jgi:hypothetical protein